MHRSCQLLGTTFAPLLSLTGCAVWNTWPVNLLSAMRPLLSPKGESSKCATPPLMSPGPLDHLSNMGLLSVAFSPCNSMMPASQIRPPICPFLSECLVRHPNRVRVSSTTHHGASTLSSKDRYDGFAPPPLISQRPSHHLPNVGFLSETSEAHCLKDSG